MTNLQPILEQFGAALEADIKQAIPKVTGETADSVEKIVTPTSLTIIADEHIGALVDGRAPTRSGASSSGKTLQQRILEWIEAKGITPKVNKSGSSSPTKEALSWAISKSIHTRGTLLYQRGGGNNIFATIITESRISALIKTITNDQTLAIESDLIKQFKFIK